LPDDGDDVTMAEVYRAAMEINIRDSLIRIPDDVMEELHRRLLEDLGPRPYPEFEQ
jgi:hypothetical protein